MKRAQKAAAAPPVDEATLALADDFAALLARYLVSKHRSALELTSGAAANDSPDDTQEGQAHEQ